MIYFDHSATTPIHPEVSERMHEINQDHFANPSSVYKSGRKAKSLIEHARFQIAESIGAKSNQVCFCSGGTEANNQVLWTLANQKDKHIIISAIEHPAISKVLERLKPFGVKASLVPVNRQGVLNTSILLDLIRDDTGLISIMLANNEIGVIQPIQKIIKQINNYNILFHTDAVQAIGKISVDVCDLGIDYMSLSAHKFYGPKGVGALFVKNRAEFDSFIVGGDQENGLRGGTENIAGIVGMGLAAELAVKNQEKCAMQLKSLEKHFLLKIRQSYPLVKHNTTNNIPGLISISFPGHKSDILMAKLDRANFAVSNGSACNTGNIKPSKVLKAIGLNDEINLSTLRISFGKDNTIEEVDELIKTLGNILN